jgi:hypothetical protein
MPDQAIEDLVYPSRHARQCKTPHTPITPVRAGKPDPHQDTKVPGMPDLAPVSKVQGKPPPPPGNCGALRKATFRERNRTGIGRQEEETPGRGGRTATGPATAKAWPWEVTISAPRAVQVVSTGSTYPNRLTNLRAYGLAGHGKAGRWRRGAPRPLSGRGIGIGIRIARAREEVKQDEVSGLDCAAR